MKRQVIDLQEPSCRLNEVICKVIIQSAFRENNVEKSHCENPMQYIKLEELQMNYYFKQKSLHGRKGSQSSDVTSPVLAWEVW